MTDAQNPLLGETTCGSLLQKLQVSFMFIIILLFHSLCFYCLLNINDVLQEIWDEVGENDEERDKMLLQLEQECLDVYKRKVEQAAKSRAQLLQALSDAKLELSTLLSALGEKSSVGIVSYYLILVSPPPMFAV